MAQSKADVLKRAKRADVRPKSWDALGKAERRRRGKLATVVEKALIEKIEELDRDMLAFRRRTSPTRRGWIVVGASAVDLPAGHATTRQLLVLIELEFGRKLAESTLRRWRNRGIITPAAKRFSNGRSGAPAVVYEIQPTMSAIAAHLGLERTPA